MSNERVLAIPFCTIYPLYVAKVERKGRTTAELDEVLTWLTGYTQEDLTSTPVSEATLADFFTDAPAYSPESDLITGVICGHRVEDIEDPLMKKIRQMDKVVDELAKGKAVEKIIRQPT